MAMPRKWDAENGDRLPCKVDECEEPIRCCGLCDRHYQTFYYHSTRGVGRKKYNKRKGS